MQCTFALDNTSIADTIETLQASMIASGLPPKEVVRHTLATEEVLLIWQGALGNEATCCLTLSKFFFRFHLRLQCAGAAVNPLPSGGDDVVGDLLDTFGYSLLLHLGAKANYSYNNGFNEIRLTLLRPHKKSPIVNLLVALAVGGAVGLTLQTYPWAPALFINNEVIVPLLKLFSSFLCSVLPFMVFFSICSSIAEMVSLQIFYDLAGKTVIRFLALNVLGAALLGIASVFLLPVPFAAADHGGDVFLAIRDMLMELVPNNFISPFIKGNIPQVVFLAFLCGSVMLLLEAQIRPFKEQLKSINLLFIKILDVLMKCIPLFIVGTIIQCFFIEVTAVYNASLTALAIGLVGMPLLSLLYFWIAALRAKRSPLKVFRLGLPAVIMSLCTMSSAASFPVLMKNCKEDMGLPEKICDFGLPVGLVLNQFPSAGIFTLVSLTCAVVFEVNISLESFIMLVLQSSVLSIATPPVAGGALLVYAVLLQQSGIPDAALGLAALLTLILDPVLTAMRTLTAQAVVIDLAGPENHAEAP